jgi:hypothetical protein
MAATKALGPANTSVSAFTVLDRDPAPMVRVAVIRETQALFAREASLYEAVERAAKADADAGVREAAARAIAAIASRG